MRTLLVCCDPKLLGIKIKNIAPPPYNDPNYYSSIMESIVDYIKNGSPRRQDTVEEILRRTNAERYYEWFQMSPPDLGEAPDGVVFITLYFPPQKTVRIKDVREEIANRFFNSSFEELEEKFSEERIKAAEGQEILRNLIEYILNGDWESHLKEIGVNRQTANKLREQWRNMKTLRTILLNSPFSQSLFRSVFPDIEVNNLRKDHQSQILERLKGLLKDKWGEDKWGKEDYLFSFLFLQLLPFKLNKLLWDITVRKYPNGWPLADLGRAPYLNSSCVNGLMPTSKVSAEYKEILNNRFEILEFYYGPLVIGQIVLFKENNEKYVVGMSFFPTRAYISNAVLGIDVLRFINDLLAENQVYFPIVEKRDQNKRAIFDPTVKNLINWNLIQNGRSPREAIPSFFKWVPNNANFLLSLMSRAGEVKFVKLTND